MNTRDNSVCQKTDLNFLQFCLAIDRASFMLYSLYFALICEEEKPLWRFSIFKYVQDFHSLLMVIRYEFQLLIAACVKILKTFAGIHIYDNK